MFVGKWWAFAAAAALELASGFNAAFILYDGALRKQFQYSNAELQALGSALVTAGLFAIVPGAIFDSLHAHPQLRPR